MGRDHAPHSAELEQVAEEHPPGVAQAVVGPDTQGAGVTSAGAAPTPTTASGRPRGLPESTVFAWQDLMDLPGQILPPETVYHLRNAGRETVLAAYSLWRSIRKAAGGPPEDRVRKHIEVE